LETAHPVAEAARRQACGGEDRGPRTHTERVKAGRGGRRPGDHQPGCKSSSSEPSDQAELEGNQGDREHVEQRKPGSGIHCSLTQHKDGDEQDDGRRKHDRAPLHTASNQERAKSRSLGAMKSNHPNARRATDWSRHNRATASGPAMVTMIAGRRHPSIRDLPPIEMREITVARPGVCPRLASARQPAASTTTSATEMAGSTAPGLHLRYAREASARSPGRSTLPLTARPLAFDGKDLTRRAAANP
jgi:hypothetical protein